MVVEDIGLIENPEWKSGLQMEEKLHAELLRFATKETTFEKLYYHMNEFIVENGFVKTGGFRPGTDAIALKSLWTGSGIWIELGEEWPKSS